MRTKTKRGFSLIELMIAMLVMAVGLLGCMTMLLIGMSSNSRNKNDSAGTMLAQMVIEQINTLPANSQPQITVTDCNGTNWTVKVQTGAAPGKGASLDATTGGIDFTQAKSNVPAGYQMDYVACGTQAGEASTFDVRWNITFISANTNLVTVSARQTAAAEQGKTTPILFSPPVTLRTIQGL
ncbi:MAG TPA: prepilin-type N-terminal cleavage/methylation domain-containing protein [Alphaproteobacteria bacterium]|nr:prepilin-type N-terminal cleavage/methylation domain-containing protein [Alphaproteobacteria bacterium]